MFKNKIFIAIVVIAVALAGVGTWYAYDRHQSALAAEKAKQEELAKAQAEKKAADEAAAKTEAEKKATEEQSNSTVEQQLSGAKEIDESQLSDKDKASIEALSKKYGPEMDAIVKLITDYNRVQNNIDYRTVTGLEGTEYMIPGTDFYKWYTSPEVVAKRKKGYQDQKLVEKFDGVNITYLVFTTPDFSETVNSPENPEYAYAEYEVISHDVEPVETKPSSSAWAAGVKKVNGQWKIYAEKRLD